MLAPQSKRPRTKLCGRHLTVALFLTMLYGTVTAYHAAAIVRASSGDIWGSRFWVLFVVLSATPLVNVRSHAVQDLSFSCCSASASYS